MELLLKTVPHPQETLSGFIIRVAEINRIYGYILYRQLGAVWSRSETRLADTETAAGTFGIAAEDWQVFEQNPFGYQLYDRGELAVQEQRFWGRFLGWYCPKCLREKHMMKGEWQFPHLPICVDHCVFLITDCPKCGRTLDVNQRRKWLTSCRCGFHYEDADAERINASGLRLGRLIRNRFVPDVDVSHVHALSQLRLGPLLRLVRFAGQEAQTASIRGVLTPDEAKRAFIRASAALDEWPGSFEVTLERMIGRFNVATELEAKSYASRFLGSTFKGEAGQPVREAFRNWCAQARSVGSVRMDASGTITVQHLAGLLLCEPNVIRQIAGTLSIPLLAPSSPGSRAMSIEKAAIPAVLKELQLRAKPQGFLRPHEAQRLLGLAKLNGLVELARDGLLAFVLHSNYVFFSQADVQSILDKLQPDRPVSESDGPTVRLLYRNQRGGVTISALILARQQREVLLLGTTGPPQRALSDLVLLKEDAHALRTPPSDGTAVGSISTPTIGTVEELVLKLKMLFPKTASAALPAVAW